MLQTPISRMSALKKAVGAEKKYNNLSDIQHLSPGEIYSLNPKEVISTILDRQDDATLSTEQKRALKILLHYKNYLKTLPNTIKPITQEEYIKETLDIFTKELKTRKRDIVNVNDEFKISGKGKTRRSSRKVKGSRKVKKGLRKVKRSRKVKKDFKK